MVEIRKAWRWRWGQNGNARAQGNAATGSEAADCDCISYRPRSDTHGSRSAKPLSPEKDVTQRRDHAGGADNQQATDLQMLCSSRLENVLTPKLSIRSAIRFA